MGPIRRRASSAYASCLRGSLAAIDVDEWPASALVVAPHPDDETLGCGGVIAKKIAAGADVHFVFVTDGAASHRSVSRERLAALRKGEALEAVGRLGGRAERVTFLAVPDGQADRHGARIAGALAHLLDEVRPACVFVPHAKDPPSDHVAVNAAARRALAQHGRRVTVFEYPIWYWYHWPWVRVGGDFPRMWRPALRQTLRTAGGLASLRTLNTAAWVADVLARKRAALAAHATQMQRLGEDWPVLADVGGGDFLALLLGDYEMYTRYRLPA